MTWPAWLILLTIAAAPFLPLDYVSGRLLAHARSLWLLGVLTVGIVWLAWAGAVWLALIGLWFLLRWPQESEPQRLLPSLLFWIGVGASWGLLLTIPRELLAWASWGWLLHAGVQSALLCGRKFTQGGRQKGTLGSPVITALSLALVSPFCPWWGWPLLGTGLVTVWSWHAALAVGVGQVWLWAGRGSGLLGPFLALAGAILGVLALWAWSPLVAGRRLLEWTPRGDTVDSIVSRLRGYQLIWHHGKTRWLFGHGPDTMEPALLRWGTRYDLELTWGEAFCDPLHLWYEYGLLGLLAAGAFAWPVVQHMNTGDPWAAAWLAGVVLSLGHWPLRHTSIALPWLAVSAYLLGGSS